MKFTNEALKIVYLNFISVSVSQYLNKIKRNVNRCICGIFSFMSRLERSFAELSLAGLK